MTAPLPSLLLSSNTAPQWGVVAVDSETSGLHVDDGATISIVSVAWYVSDDERVAYAWPFDQGPLEDKPLSPAQRKKHRGMRGLFDDIEVADNLPEDEWRALMKWLGQWKHVYHNAKFDLLHLANGTRYFPGVDFTDNLAWDTKLGQWVLEPLETTSLKPTADRLWADGGSNEQAALKPYLGPKDDPRFDLVPWSVIGPYAAKDADLTIRLWAHQQDRLDDPDERGARQIIDHEIEVCRVLTRMEMRGIGYDFDAAVQAREVAQIKLGEVVAALPFSPPTVTKARRWFYDEKVAIPHCTTTVKGEPSVGECCVRTLISQEIPGAQEWAQYQKISNAIARWYDSFMEGLGSDGRLRTDMKQDGTVNMRFSSQRKNLQALPHDYRLISVEGLGGLTPPRSLFRAAPGKTLMEMDLSQAELRRGTRISGCGAMLEAIRSGDPHGMTARQLFNVTPEDDDWFKYRQVSKRSNFGLIYLIGPDTFMADLEKQTGILISRGEADRIVKDWRALYPEFPAINKRVELAARRRGYVKLVGGRKRYFKPYEELHKAFNAKIQGDIAQVMKVAMVQIDQRWPGTLLLQIHDSLVVEVPAGEEEMAQEMSDCLAEIATVMFDCEMESEVKRWHK